MNISLLYNVFMGETSPLIVARIDMPAHEMGASRMENLIPMLTGGLRKRPGTWFDGTSDSECKLIGWLLSDGTYLILQLNPSQGYMVIWQRESPDSYSKKQIDLNVKISERFQCATSGNIMCLVSQEHPPIFFTWREGEITIEAKMFTGEYDFNMPNNHPGAVAFYAGRLCFANTKNYPNRIFMSRAYDSQTGKNRYTDFTTEERYKNTRTTSRIAIDENGNELTDPVLDADGNQLMEPDELSFEIAGNKFIFRDKTYYISWSFKDHMYEYTLNLYILPNQSSYVGKLDLLHNPYENTLIVKSGSGIGESIANRSPYFCRPETMDENNSVFELHNQWYHEGKPITKPRYITETEETENVIITASHAIVLEENDMHGSSIQWMSGHRLFLAATERATWSDTGEIPTPATFDMNIIEYAGANELQAKGTKETMVYAGRDGKSLHALVWNSTANGSGFIGIGISEKAAHLFSSGIKDFDIMDYPFPVIWIVTNAGDLISCTINIREGFFAYARHRTDGIVGAVAVAMQKTEDVVFLSVKRGNTWNIEHLIFEDLVNADFTDSHYVDAGECRTFSTPTKTIEGLHRFAGKTIHVFADEAIEPPVKVNENGMAELQNKVSKAHLGLPYKAVFSPNTRQIPANGTSIGKKRRIDKIILQLYKSIGGKAGTTEKKSTELITQKFGDYKLGTAPEPFTGEYEIIVSGNIDTEGKLVVTHDEPCPFTMLALVERVTILEA
jgi:hypothetical protein